MILSIIKLITALPKLQALVELFIAQYISIKRANFSKGNQDAISKAIYEHDQRGIEHQMGSNVEGKPSGEAGTTIDDSLPPNIS